MNCRLQCVLMLLCLSCFSNYGSAQTLESQFQQVLDTTYNSNKDAFGILISIESKKNEISWTQSIGYSDKRTKEILKPNQPALIASNTKTYVAVAIMKLIEIGKIELLDGVNDFLKPNTRLLLSNAGYDLNKITVEQLLSHTAGINDYVDSVYFSFVDEAPQHKWTRAAQIELSAKKGAPKATPGEQFSYGDINYLLLSEIIENKTEQPFYLAIRELIGFENLGLNSTWFIQLEDKPQGVEPLVHQYWHEQDWDSYNLDPSWDLYGGGGLVSTVNDLGLFFQKLFNYEIISDTMLLSEMSNYVLPKDQSNYCLGLQRISFHGLTGYYHGGFWGTDVMYLPKYDLTIAVFTLQKDKRGINAEISFAIIKCIEKMLNKN